MACKLKNFAAATAVLLLATSCSLFEKFGEDVTGHLAGEWKIVNNSGKDVVVHTEMRPVDYNYNNNLPSGGSVNDWDSNRYDDTTASFDELLTAHLERESDPKFSIEVNGVIVKTWKYSERNDPGRQYFNEQSWTKTEKKKGGHPYNEWTFELLPEDIE